MEKARTKRLPPKNLIDEPCFRYQDSYCCVILRGTMLYFPGDHVCITGAYEVMHGGHRPPHEAWLVAEETFPRCRQCGTAVIFKFGRRATKPTCDHISSDQDFLTSVTEA